MADDRWVPPRPALTPEDVAHRGFGTSFRGFDTAEVRDYLAAVADTMRAARDAQRELERRLREAEERAAHPEIDESMLMAALGEETARLLRSAHEAAADIRAKAEENAERMLKEANGEIAALRAKAEGLLAERTAEADEAAGAIRAAGETDAAGVVAEAREKGDKIIAVARAEAEALIAEATQRRAELLRDLTRKRRVANIQVEQLRAGREKLLETYAVVRRTLDEVTAALERAEDDARSAAFAAGNRAARELDAAGEELADVLAGVDDPTGDGAEVAPAESEPGAVAAAADVDEATPAPQAPAVAPPTPLPEPQPTATRPREESNESDSRPRRPGRPLPSIAAPRAGDSVSPDRPTSSLRIIRGPKPADTGRSREADSPARTAGGPVAEEPPPISPALTVVQPTSELEGVRVIPAGRTEPTPTDTTGTDVATDVTTDAVGEVAVEDVAAAKVEPAGAAVAPGPDDESDDVAEPAAVGKVDDLFARLRAGREEAVAHARAVLAADHEAGGSADAAAPSASAPNDAASSVSADTEADDVVLERRAALLDPLAAQLARRLKRALQDDQNDALDRLRSRRGPIDLDAAFGAAEHQRGRYETAAEVFIEEAAQGGVAHAGGSASLSGAVMRQIVVDLAESIVGPLRRRIEQRLHEAVAVGDDESTVVERVGAAYREWKTQRVELLAGDHVHKAFAAGAYANTAPGSLVRWVVDDVGGACPDCDDNALAGPTPAGETFPTGQVHPPAHAGCRCLLVVHSV